MPSAPRWSAGSCDGLASTSSIGNKPRTINKIGPLDHGLTENDLGDSVKLGLHARYGGYALVTGAARGIGRAFATYLAADGFDLLLVDREADETTALAKALHAEHGIDARALVYDLADPGLATKAQEWAEAYEVGLLVNNAGISVLDPFFEISLETHLATLDLNCRATLMLTYIIGKKMARQ
ncbi:MAG: SDR family NAD(P)-dependent oxidoreductase, partial [Deltaproteobacteria bacterium]|nr:SDR family NAD(P)-dependent oxidoreductase [Deltaproteobacteria bacterium]